MSFNREIMNQFKLWWGLVCSLLMCFELARQVLSADSDTSDEYVCTALAYEFPEAIENLDDFTNARYKLMVDEAVKLADIEWDSKTNITTMIKFKFKQLPRNVLAKSETMDNFLWEGVLYPNAMAKAMGITYDRGETDIRVTVQKRRSIHFYTEYYPGANFTEDEHDMITVLLHEIQHGLMHPDGDIVDLTQLRRQRTSAVLRDPPGRWEQMLVYQTRDGQYCSLHSLKDNPFLLHKAITRGLVYFWDPNAEHVMARIHVEHPFDHGSNLIHLHEQYTNTMDGLMCARKPQNVTHHTVGEIWRRMYDILQSKDQEVAPFCDDEPRPDVIESGGPSGMSLEVDEQCSVQN